MQRSLKSKTKLRDYTPRIILTTGDPCGIGPEIILKILADKSVNRRFKVTICGSRALIAEYAGLLGMKIPESAVFEEVNYPNDFKLQPGRITAAGGKHSGDCIIKAVKQCMSGKYDAIVTMPISKEALNLGGYDFPGHTEMLEKLTGSSGSLMMMCSPVLKVCLVTNHLPVSKVSRTISKELIKSKVITAHNSLNSDFNIKHPKIALLSLNPHAGDGGLIGSQEEKIILPAIRDLAKAAYSIDGPFPADAFFATKAYRRFDIAVAMYHDQGLIPFKMLSTGEGVNFTAGIGIIRTSPDHGTAFDIAGKGKASASSTLAAINIAGMLIKNRLRGSGLFVQP